MYPEKGQIEMTEQAVQEYTENNQRGRNLKKKILFAVP